ncbi:hypothetical protein [Falsiroseomonas ponticola]|jgi:hypothetical protein|uniref:hypothetical protein n=1 Tax=Falsiroseomonas ponticola TaxID=2786951 RepID=UPI0019322042|nr:hypothetical protein [Roseomonas ponticola]
MTADSTQQETGEDRRIASDPRWLAAGAAGLAAAVLTLWGFRGMPGGALTLWLAPMPLFMAGIGFGAGAVIAAVGVALVAVMAVGTSLGAGLFLGIFGAPVAALVLVARRGPTAVTGMPDLAAPFTLLGILPAAGVAVAAWLLSDVPGGLEGALRGAVEQAMSRMGLPASDGIVAELVRVKAAAIGFWVTLALLINAAAASGLLVRFGIITARPAFREARLPAWYALLPALALGLWLVAAEGSDAVELSLLLALLVPVFLHGLAAFHRATRALRGRPMVLGGAYAALLIMSVPVALAVTGYGLFDILNGTRGRRGAPPPQR